jgi:hypothetical protein
MTTLPITTVPITTVPITTVPITARTTTRSLRQLKAQMAQLRATTVEVDLTLALLRPPTGQPVALAAPPAMHPPDVSEAALSTSARRATTR